MPYGSIYRKSKLYVLGEGLKGRAAKGQTISRAEKEALASTWACVRFVLVREKLLYHNSLVPLLGSKSLD